MSSLAKNINEVKTIKVDIKKISRPDGSVVLQSTIPLDPCPHRLTERLKHWASVTPNQIFIGRRNTNGNWIELSFSETYSRVACIAQALLDRKLSSEKPIAILSENSIDHALLALAAMHVGIPYSSIAPAYSLRSKDFLKLRYVVELLDPGLIYVSDAKQYEKALQAVAGNIEIVASNDNGTNLRVTSFESLLKTTPTVEVEKAFQAIQPNTIAKILFTSGSTGSPKGVINTHENISSNWQQITQTFPFLKDEGLEFIDWLPWNHTFGGNHNFGLALFNGGSIYIDDGNPTPEGVQVTIKNLQERNPTVYFNVPKGFEELLPYFKKDRKLAVNFFSKLKMLFYAGAGMPQHVWDAWQELSIEITGRKILIGTGLGCTESCPSALFASEPGGFAGLLGVPVPGLELKLVPEGDKMEARYRGKNIFPGYWRQPDFTAQAFDEEGFYRTGDALIFVDKSDANKGMLFDGRLSEDFKLNTGTWVRVGPLRSEIIAEGNGLIQDVVITGHDRGFIGAIVLLRRNDTNGIEHLAHAVQNVLEKLATKSTGSATFIQRAVVAELSLSIDKGEITDKGSINQRMIIQNFPALVEGLYATSPAENIIQINKVQVKHRLEENEIK